MPSQKVFSYLCAHDECLQLAFIVLLYLSLQAIRKRKLKVNILGLPSTKISKHNFYLELCEKAGLPKYPCKINFRKKADRAKLPATPCDDCALVSNCLVHACCYNFLNTAVVLRWRWNQKKDYV